MAINNEVWVRENDGREVSLADSSSEGLARAFHGWAYNYGVEIRLQQAQPETRQAFFDCAMEFSKRQKESVSGLRDDEHLKGFISITGEREYSLDRRKDLADTAKAILRAFGWPIHIGTDIGTGLRPVRGGNEVEAQAKPKSSVIYIPG